MPSLPCDEMVLENKANAINSLLQKESIIALVAMAGIGKTTLSKKMYHLFHNQYEKSSFLDDVKSKDINNVRENFYKICVIENYTRMRMLMNTLMKLNSEWYQRMF
jgi:ABC-type glutathione transport system ATPase component